MTGNNKPDAQGTSVPPSAPLDVLPVTFELEKRSGEN